MRLLLVEDDADLGASREARCVVQSVLEHARTRPHESLGVIALGIHHADRIEMALDRERQRHPELDAFFASDRAERFFVKNLERVQGEEESPQGGRERAEAQGQQQLERPGRQGQGLALAGDGPRCDVEDQVPDRVALAFPDVVLP